jgi:GrpB-like predicted nucleotidyltransferase (UPF0157 family)
MSWKDIEKITGLPAGSCDGVSAFHVYHFDTQEEGGVIYEGVKLLGIATSLAGALDVIRTKACPDGWPEIDPEELGAFEDPDLGRLAWVLGVLPGGFPMERTTAEDGLGYLAEVIEDYPELRLLVAWEAAAPYQDDAFGIFVPRPPREVIVVDYDPQWPTTFEVLRARTLRALEGIPCDIVHVGSTSVPGLAAKPIIDIDVIVQPEEPLATMVARLRVLGYVHQGNLEVEGREAFRALPEDPLHNLYVCPEDSPALRNHLRFRDHLRAHPDVAAAYGALKKELALRFRWDIEGYVAGKTDFIVGILEHLGFPETELATARRINKR